MDPDWQLRRAGMVDHQIRARGISEPRLLRAMATVPRHEFVPLAEQGRAYLDGPIAIGFGQTISQPYIVALMTDLLQVGQEHRVLEIGTGSGYQTAILAELAAEVFTIEIYAALQEAAHERLDALGYGNIRFAVRNGYSGWEEEAPFDRIMVTAGAPSIPSPLIHQLAPRGRAVIPVGPASGDQKLQLVAKSQELEIDIRDLVPVRFVPLIDIEAS
jgi:protein-L-isoaspartate(D-aspartate) O-methyltransferase